MSSKTIEERLERVEWLLAGEVEAMDVVDGTRLFFAGDHPVRECGQWYAEACAEGPPLIDRDYPPYDAGTVQPAGSFPVGTYVTYWDTMMAPASWWCFRITATARGLERGR